jgi:hypothetical protein
MSVKFCLWLFKKADNFKKIIGKEIYIESKAAMNWIKMLTKFTYREAS